MRHVLPAIRVPTLVLHRRGDRAITIENGRYLANHIPGAQFVELPGDDHISFMGDADGLLDTVQHFVTDLEPANEPYRVLTTILALAAGAGPTDSPAPLQLSPAQQAAVRRELARFRGQEVRSDSGELLAAFDGPARAIRAGLHTGECEIVEGTLRGAAVATAGRVAARALAGQVLASSTVKDPVAGTGLSFCAAGCLADAAGQARPLFLVT